MNKKFSFSKVFALAFVLFVLASGVLYAESTNLSFTLVNRSGFVIQKLYLSPSELSRWDWDEDEIVGDGFPVSRGDKIDINMNNNADRMKFRHWDMRVIFDDGKYWEFHAINLSSINTMNINVDGRGLDDLGEFYTSTKNSGK